MLGRMMVLYVAILLLFVVDVVLMIRVGYTGLRADVSVGPIPFWDFAWGCPLAVLSICWSVGGAVPDWTFTPAVLLSLAALTTGAMAFLPLVLLLSVLSRMPAHRRMLAEKTLHLGKLRAIARGCVWLGAIAALASLQGLGPHWAWTLAGWLYCAVAVFPAMLGLSMWRRRAWGSTPFDPAPKSYDLFMSYKSEDVAVARLAADQLIAAGINVWFAEYQILLSGRASFQKAIDDGIGRSAYGLALTNDRYVRSYYCRREMRRLLSAGGMGPRRVLQVKIPEQPLPHRRFPALREGPAIHYETHVNEVLSFVESQTGWTLPRMDAHTPAGRQEHLGQYAGCKYRLDITGWTVVDPGGRELPNGNVDGPVLARTGGPYRMTANLVIGPDNSRRERASSRVLDDRKVYNHLVDFASFYVSGLAAEPRGVHLLFHSGYSQLGVTYWFHVGWHRKCSILLPDGRGSASLEFAFTFSFAGPFREYCRHAHVMDALALSLRFG